MPTRPEFIGHWTELEDVEETRYRGDDEAMGFDASLGEKLGLKRIGHHYMRVPPGRRISYPHDGRARIAEDHAIPGRASSD